MIIIINASSSAAAKSTTLTLVQKYKRAASTVFIFIDILLSTHLKLCPENKIRSATAGKSEKTSQWKTKASDLRDETAAAI